MGFGNMLIDSLKTFDPQKMGDKNAMRGYAWGIKFPGKMIRSPRLLGGTMKRFLKFRMGNAKRRWRRQRWKYRYATGTFSRTLVLDVPGVQICYTNLE